MLIANLKLWCIFKKRKKSNPDARIIKAAAEDTTVYRKHRLLAYPVSQIFGIVEIKLVAFLILHENF